MPSSYGKIQFIGYGIRTDIANSVDKDILIPTKPSVSFLADGTYLGLPNENADIIARCQLMRSAIMTAKGLATSSPDTLKVFMAPEFFFRGAQGAYSFEGRDKVVKELQDMVKHAGWQDWLFVFGSIISWSAPARKRPTGLFGSKSKYDQIDIDKAKEVYNTVLVQQGGWEGKDASEQAWVVTKQFKADRDFKWFDDFLGGKVWSGAPRDLHARDFVNMKKTQEISHPKGWELALSDWDVWRDLNGESPDAAVNVQFEDFKKKTKARFEVFADTRTKRIAKARQGAFQGPRQYHRYAGTGVFQFHGIDFSLEVCLDHSKARLKNAAGGDPTCEVDVHLLPSAGMSIHDDSVVARDGGYVFNCDGTRDTPANPRQNPRSMPCVALKWSPGSPKPLQATLVKPAPVPEPSGINVDALFPHGAGEVHVFTPARLP